MTDQVAAETDEVTGLANGFRADAATLSKPPPQVLPAALSPSPDLPMSQALGQACRQTATPSLTNWLVGVGGTMAYLADLADRFGQQLPELDKLHGDGLRKELARVTDSVPKSAVHPANPTPQPLPDSPEGWHLKPAPPQGR